MYHASPCGFVARHAAHSPRISIRTTSLQASERSRASGRQNKKRHRPSRQKKCVSSDFQAHEHVDYVLQIEEKQTVKLKTTSFVAVVPI